MSKEAMDDCICGQKIAFMQYHWPHCSMNPANMSANTPLRKSLEVKFTKAQLAHIAQHGGGQVQDQAIGTRRSKARRPKR